MIEKLKKNEKEWSRLTEEERACLENVKRVNCVFWDGDKWVMTNTSMSGFGRRTLYRIKDSYTPEPEIERCEVYIGETVLMYIRKGEIPQGLLAALEDPDFIDWLDKDGKSTGLRTSYLMEKDTPAAWPKTILFRRSK